MASGSTFSPLSGISSGYLPALQQPAAAQSSTVLGRDRDETASMTSSTAVEKLHQMRIQDALRSDVKPRLDNMPPVPKDMFSNADPSTAVTTHMKLNINKIDFEERKLSAQVQYKYSNLKSGNEELVLDVDNLAIKEVLVNGKSAEYEIIKSKFHDALCIHIPTDKEGVVSIEYETGKDAKGLFWIPKNVMEEKQPVLYTQAEDIIGSSWLPGQHSPQVRVSWEVNINTGSPNLMAVVSSQNNPEALSADGKYTNLTMEPKLPIYLLGIAVGPWAFRRYNKGCGIFGQASKIDHVAKAYDRLPEFLEKAGQLLKRPYVKDWKVYTPINLPQAYPYMAMEHACCTFFGGNTIDQPGVWIHEIAHAWAGNLITNGIWTEFFWNEGMTMYIENRVCQACLGDDYAAMTGQTIVDEAMQDMEEFKKNNQPNQCRLCMQYEGERIDFSRVPYGKGMLFFMMLENAFGRTVWDQILSNYMQIFAHESMCRDRFMAFLEMEVKARGIAQDFKEFKARHLIDEWLDGIDIPKNAPVIESKLLSEIRETIKNFLEGKDVSETLRKYDAVQASTFISGLQEKATKEQVANLDRLMNFTHDKRSMVKEEFLVLCAKSGNLPQETWEVLKEYVILRNSKSRAKRISSNLLNLPNGHHLVQEILKAGEKDLFPLTKAAIHEAIEEHEKAQKKQAES